MSNLRELVKEFGKSAGLSGLQLDDDGLCRIVIDGATTIDFELSEDGKALLLTGHVLALDEEADPEAFATAMMLNAGVAQNGGSFLAFDAAEEEILLLRRIEDDQMRSGAFEAMLNRFAAYLETCRAALQSPDSDGDEEEDELDGGDAAATPEIVFRL